MANDSLIDFPLDDEPNPTDNGRNIHAIFAKVPFPQLNSAASIETWFIKMEAWFDLQGLGVRKEIEKYKAVIAYLDQKYLDQVHDLVHIQPASEPYTKLKEALLARFAESEMAKLDKLANGILLGDGRPSHLLSQLQRLNATSDDSVVRRYWIKRLPTNVRGVVAGMMESSPQIPLSQLAKTADAILDTIKCSGENVASITTFNENQTVNAITSSNDRIGRLEKRTEKTEQMLLEINSKLGQLLGKGRSRSKSQQRTTTASDENPTYCWYHAEYGIDAKKCIEPCTYNANPKN